MHLPQELQQKQRQRNADGRAEKVQGSAEAPEAGETAELSGTTKAVQKNL